MAKAQNGYNKIIHKTVQAWIQSVEFRRDGVDPHVGMDKVVFPTLYGLAQKIALATGMTIQFATSSTKFQVKSCYKISCHLTFSSAALKKECCNTFVRCNFDNFLAA